MEKIKCKRDKRMDILTFLVLSIFYMEMVLRVFCAEQIITWSVIYILSFSAALGLILKILFSFFEEKVNRILAAVLLVIINVIYCAQLMYRLFFGKFLVLYSMIVGGVDQVANEDMISTTLQAIRNSIIPGIILLVPFLFFCVFGRKTIKMPRAKWGMKLILAGGVAVISLCGIFMIKLIPEKEEVRNSTFDADIYTEHFGLFYMGVQDFKYHALGIKQDIELEQTEILELTEEITITDSYEEEIPEEENPEEVVEQEVVYEPNIWEIDFDKLLETEEDDTIRMLHEYFRDAEPTYKNEYTGMFEGYNVITITAEGFSPFAIHEELTPTLYKMMTEGFVFNNFYTPIWGVSTSDGEYVSCTGLLPKSGVWSFYESGENEMPFCLGNQFEKEGVDLRFAYHNHTYDYYHRDVSHPNMGYEYKGLGKGFTTEQIKKTWPESDLQMIEASVADFVQSEERFAAYYMTVSGHLEYTRIGNSMASKNWEYVENLEMSDVAKAYIACNMELEFAMEKLMSELEKAGIADKTLIAIVPDHYPYGLETDNEEDYYDYFNEFLGHEVETNFELYKSVCILYSASMEEPVVVDKYAANVDLLPTVSNLLGLEYDSRMLVGKDILSDEEQLLIFSNRSWISEYGRYNGPKKEFEAFDESVFESEEQKAEYVESVKEKVEEQFQISALILTENYYEKIIK